MKAFGVVMSVLMILAGIVVGRLEYDREKAGGFAGPATGRAPTGGGPAAVTEGQSIDRVTPEGVDDRGPSGERTDTRTAVPPTAAASDAHRRGLEDVERLVARQQFERAAEMARTLMAALDEEGVPASDETFVAARRLAAKASVFGILIDNIERTDSPPLGSRVLLANGNTIEVVRADRDGDRYVLALPNGISYRPRVDEVREVVAMSPEEHRSFVAREWERLRKRLENLEDPVDLYVRGVERCYRSGLEEEGLKLLERLLALPESETIPRRFAGAKAAAAVREWQVAAGRDAPETAPSAAALNPAQTRRDQAPGSGAVAGSQRAVLARVTSLRDEARQLYRRGFKDEGDGRSLRQARERLEEAFTLIESLSASEEVDELRRDLGQLLSDVVRVSPF